MKKQLIVLSAPSGSGKTTVARHLLTRFPALEFSVSATTRGIRPNEVDGRDYRFLSRDEFRAAIERGDLIEYEEIFGNYYGTLRSQVQAALDRGAHVVFDVDVKGALSLLHAFPDDTLLIFIAPPSLEVLEERLRERRTETDEQISLRMARAEMEMGHRAEFAEVIVNDVLIETLARAEAIVAIATEGSPIQQGMFDS